MKRIICTKKKSRVIINLLTLPVFSVLLFGCSEKPKPPKAIIRNVYVTLPKVEKINKTINTYGKLNSSKTVKIKAQVTGIIEEIHFKEGAHIKKGDLLINIDPAEYQTQLEIDKAQLGIDTEDYVVKKYLTDQTKILELTEAISKNEYAKAVAKMKQAKSQVELSKGVVKKDEINLGYCEIKSPINGVISSIKVDTGNLVIGKSDEVLTTIRKVTPLYVDFSIPDTYYTKLKECMKENELDVEVQVRQKGKQSKDEMLTHKGKLDFLDNTVNPETGTILLRATIDNTKNELWPGQMVRIGLILGEKDNALLVPTKAVRLGKTGDYLYVATADNKAKLVYVKIGQVVGDETVILDDGIKSTDKVITVGLESLGDDSSIKIIKDLSKPEK